MSDIWSMLFHERPNTAGQQAQQNPFWKAGWKRGSVGDLVQSIIAGMCACATHNLLPPPCVSLKTLSVDLSSPCSPPRAVMKGDQDSPMFELHSLDVGMFDLRPCGNLSRTQGTCRPGKAWKLLRERDSVFMQARETECQMCVVVQRATEQAGGEHSCEEACPTLSVEQK